MKAEIISIGTELLMGELTDTNATFIASRLPALGIQLQWVSQVGDDLDMLSSTIIRGLDRSDAIFTSGGLGPTQDDLTREATAKALGEEMRVRDDLLEDLKENFRRRGAEMPATNIKQATIIPSAQSLPNIRGTAPGWWVERDGKYIVTMPGPPAELQGIWQDEVVPRLLKIVRGEVILTRNIKTSGVSEGAIDEMVTQYLGKDNPYLGIYSKADGIHLRVIARGATEEEARNLVRPVEEGIVSILGPHIWGYDDETPEQAVGQLLLEKGLTLATMETCTGGLLANNISEVPGSSSYFLRGVVISSRESAVASGVPAAIIEEYGIVSPQAAEGMAQAARSGGGISADVGLGVAGVLGPEDLEGKPPGTYHIAIAMGAAGHDPVTHVPGRLPPRRQVIRRRVSSTALIELRRILSTL